MDLQPRAPKHGARRHHANAEACTGSVVPLLATAKSGGITVRICEEGGRILDPFAGSGTTLVAAELEGYDWTGIEMTQHYFDVARSRLPPP